MPTGNLPASGKALWERVYEDAKKGSCKDAGERKDECAARVAWTAVKNAGWKKDADGNWHKSSFTEFSLRIERASYDKATNERRWRAVASDTDEDSRQDSMSLELFNDFIGRIETGEPVPEDFRSEFWKGGMPYLSVSHYPDLNGEAVPGVVDAVYIDGNYLKAKGKFHDNPLGRKCFEAICADLYGTKSETDDKVRISIAFLDWVHKHKSSGFVFEREDEEDICPECLKEIIKGNGQGKIFLGGHLVHLAMTRVPVNKRTDMEVDKSMADIKTRKDDAASIVGDELAEELEEKAKLVGKSEVLVIRSEDVESGDDTPVVEEAKSKKKEQEQECAEDDEECKERMGKKEEKSDVSPVAEVQTMSKADYDNIISVIRSTITESINLVVRPVEPTTHPLDAAFASFKSSFDQVSSIEGGEQDKMSAIQEPFNVLGREIVEVIKSSVKTSEPEPVSEVPAGDMATALSKAIADALNPIAQKLDLVSAQLQSKADQRVPQRRSVVPTLEMQSDVSHAVKQSETPKLRAIIERTTK